MLKWYDPIDSCRVANHEGTASKGHLGKWRLRWYDRWNHTHPYTHTHTHTHTSICPLSHLVWATRFSLRMYVHAQDCARIFTREWGERAFISAHNAQCIRCLYQKCYSAHVRIHVHDSHVRIHVHDVHVCVYSISYTGIRVNCNVKSMMYMYIIMSDWKKVFFHSLVYVWKACDVTYMLQGTPCTWKPNRHHTYHVALYSQISRSMDRGLA
jgi:hypothetical protein